jgi:hypothetical protein
VKGLALVWVVCTAITVLLIAYLVRIFLSL